MTATIEKDKNGDYFLPLSNKIIKELNLKTGDKVEIIQRKHGVIVVPLPDKMVKNRDGEDTQQLYEVVEKEYKGVHVTYVSQYYLDFAVEEGTYNIDRSRKEKFFTEDQVSQNLKAFKEAYIDAKDGKTNKEMLLENYGKMDLIPLIDKGVVVFGCFDKFYNWLYEENLALGSKPIGLLSSESGIKRVIDILGRIEHGIIS